MSIRERILFEHERPFDRTGEDDLTFSIRNAVAPLVEGSSYTDGKTLHIETEDIKVKVKLSRRKLRDQRKVIIAEIISEHEVDTKLTLGIMVNAIGDHTNVPVWSPNCTDLQAMWEMSQVRQVLESEKYINPKQQWFI